MKTRTKVILGSLAAVLLLGPFAVPVNTSGAMDYKEAAEISWQGRSEFVNLVDHDVHIVTAGDESSERLIVLLHGFGASSLTWSKTIDDLAAGSFVVAYDRAAFGFTERPANIGEVNPYSSQGQLRVVDGLVEVFGENKEVVILGHSAGGAIALGYALDHPDKVDQLILEAPAVYGTGGSPSWLNWVFSIPQLDHLGPLAVASIASSGLDLLETSYTDPKLITQEVEDGYTAPLKIAGWERAFWEFNKAPRSLDLVERFGELRARTLIITGDDDRVVATADSIKLHGDLTGSELVTIEGAGHLPNEEKPQEFVDAVLSFLN